MSERLPYEEQLPQQWDDLPLPDENMAWADMKRRLEEDDNDGLIPFWLRGCALWGLLGLALLGLGWWIIQPGKWFDKKKNTEKVNKIGKNKNVTGDSVAFTIRDTNKTTNNIHANNKKDSIGNKMFNSSGDSSLLNAKKDQSKAITGKEGGFISVTTNGSIKKQKNKTAIVPGKKDKNIKGNQKDGAAIVTQKNTIDENDGNINKNITPVNNKPIHANDSSFTNKKDNIKVDSLKKTNADALKKEIEKDTVVKNKETKKDSSRKKTISFSAGIALQQQLPINGQQLTPYNSLGRKGSLADYIPSVYVRMYKNNKWFLQSEFRYGAPQYNKELLYNQKSQVDTTTQKIITTSTKLKKTFYHQLPVTFNYFVLPNWSVGAGFSWNKFNGAVSAQDVDARNYITGIDSVISTGKILSTKKADSVFVQSYFQAIIETQFRLKRFSFGARYAFGLQPYIKFTLPGGTLQQEKNSSIQVFLRYELWRSKKR